MAQKAKINPDKLKEQVREYAENEKGHYDEYAQVMETILKAACNIHAPLGIVQARSKSISSFAEKCARKAHKYDDSVHQLTDLCGARVIVNTSDEMRAICGFVRHEFVVDEANTDDASGRLREEEFGYRSFHFVVQVGKAEILNVPTRLDSIENRKAEIQVRTVAQHAWAAVTHDRLFKGAFAPPSRLKRLAHRAAALLEDADEALNSFEVEMQSFLGSYSAYMKPADLALEIEIVEFVLEVDKEASTALRLARLLHAAGRLDKAIEVITPFKAATGSIGLPILVELGAALVETGNMAEGCKLLREAVKIGADDETDDLPSAPNSDRKLRATALAILAARCSDPEQVSERYTDSLQLDPDDPYTLCAQLAYNLEHTNQPAILDSARPAILSALNTCRAHVGVGLQLPRAWFTMGRLLLMLRRDAEALDSYSKAIRFYLADGAPTWSAGDFEAEIAFLKQVGGRTKDIPPENKWARQLLRMGYWLKNKPNQTIADCVERTVTFGEFNRNQRVLIVAGGTRPDVQTQMESYRDLLKAALDRFDGVVISGGTTAGIPGLVGEVAAELKKSGRKNFQLIGYRPKFARNQSPHYDCIVESGQDEVLGLAEPLQMWLDLLAAGVEPAAVRLLGINGGRISRFEYALALAFGALIGLVESSGRSADWVLRDPDWGKHPRLLPLPSDAMTAQAFTRVGNSNLPPDELERMGKIAHDVYREGMKPDYRRPNTLPWEYLPEQYKKSSRDQAAYAFEILHGSGFQIKKASGNPAPTAMPESFVELMGEQEHGRWNFERLETGWRRAPNKNDESKLSPHLKAWMELPQEIKEYDRKAVRAFPRILAEAGYELVLPPP